EIQVEETQVEETQVEETQVEETQVEEEAVTHEEGKYDIDLSVVAESSSAIVDPALSHTDDFAHLVIAGEAGESVVPTESATQVSAPTAMFSVAEQAGEETQEASEEVDELLVADSVGELADSISQISLADEIDVQESESVRVYDDDEEDRDAQVIAPESESAVGVAEEQEVPEGAVAESSIEESAILISDGESDNESDVTARARSLEQSVNMEDSQAELLSSNLLDSMYRSSIVHGVQDEIHALESEGPASLSSVDESEELGGVAALPEQEVPAVAVAASATEDEESQEAARYVVSPGAFTNEPEPDVIMHLRPVSVAQQSGSPATPELTPAAVEEETVEADNETEVVEQVEAEEEGPGSVHVARSEADSFVHVEDGEEADGVATVPESVAEEISDVESVHSEEPQQAAEVEEEEVKEVKEEHVDVAEPIAEIADKAVDEASTVIDEINADEVADKIVEDINAAIEKSGIAEVANTVTEEIQAVIDDITTSSVADQATREINEAVDSTAQSKDAGADGEKKKEKKESKKKAVSKNCSACPVNVSTFAGVVAVALAAMSRHYFRLPGAQNRQIAIAGGVASAIAGLGFLASVFFRRK
ncbi:hypothetical protein FBU59_001571, partial [Linderina macrospora]